MKRKPELTDPAKLAAYCDEHLYYEVSMAMFTAELLSVPFRAPRKGLATVFRCAVIESFATHVRNLVDFFYPRRTVQKSDVIAADYYPAGVLPSDFPGIPLSLERARNRADKELAHLTVERMFVAPTDKPWPHREIVTELKSLLGRFVREGQNLGTVLGRYVSSLTDTSGH